MVDLKQFFVEVCTMRKLMGEKTFWANPQAIELAKKALFVTYVEAKVQPGERAQLVTTYTATMLEFTRRAMLLGIDL